MSEVFRTPDERFEDLEGYSWEPNYLELGGELEGLRLHYVDSGEGDPVVLLHGEPTWAYLYRKVIPGLERTNRVLAPDFIGFGRSDKVTDVGWYSYDKHVESLHRFLRYLDLWHVTLVVQDWGGPIGLCVATEAEDRIARLVILNTGIFRPGPGWPTPGFMAWRNFAVENPDLPVGVVLQSATTTDLSPEILRGYEAPFPSPESKAGAAAFPLLVPLTADDPGARRMSDVAEALTKWDKPALVAFSDSDPIFSVRAGERLAGRIPGAASFVTVEGASHFLQEDKGETVAMEIARFVTN